MKTKTEREIQLELTQVKSILNALGKLLLPVIWEAKDVFSTLYSAQKEICFQDFLDGIAFDLSYNDLNENDVKLLTKKMSNSKNYQSMSNILDSVFFSKSKLSRTILGLITGKFLREDTLDYEDLVLICALKDTFDEDIKMFWDICDLSPSTTNKGARTVFLTNYSERDRLIVEKLQNNGIFGRDLAEGRLHDPDMPLRYDKTGVSARLRHYIEFIKSIF